MQIRINILSKCYQSKRIEHIEEVLTPRIFAECSGSLFLVLIMYMKICI